MINVDLLLVAQSTFIDVKIRQSLYTLCTKFSSFHNGRYKIRKLVFNV